MQADLELLKRHNAWRRGADTEMEDVRLLSMAIDNAIAEIEDSRRGECICKKCGLRKDGGKPKVNFW